MSLDILLVDDDQQLCELLSAVLGEQDHRVHQTRRLAQARAELSRRGFDLLVVDGLLPDGVGTDLIAELRDRDDQTPVVFISTFFRDIASYRELTGRLKVAQVIHKPFSPREFMVQMSALIARVARGEARVDAPPVSSEVGDELQSRLAQMRAAYAQKLPQRLGELQRALQQAREVEGGSAALRAARDFAHKLHGSAGSYGLHDVSLQAGRIEAAVRGLAERPGDGALWHEVEVALQRLLEGQQPTEAETVPDKRPPLPTATLLLVDDDERFTQQVERAARANLLEVITARDADDALRRVAGRKIDAALLEVGAGEQIARRLRAEKRLRGLPMAFVAGDAGLHDRVAAVHAGASLFLAKPLAEAELIDAVNLLCAERRSRHRVLIIDDDLEAASAVASLLEGEEFEPTVLEDATAVVETLQRINPDVLVLDLMMPRVSGFDICKVLRTSPRWQALPVLVLTAQAGSDVRIAAFEAGADDYLLKPVIREELLARIQQRLDYARLLRERSERDALTGLLSRRAFAAGLGARLAEAQRSAGIVSCCLIDIDRFKQVNDRHGHLAGDRVLAQIGRMLQMRFRSFDLRGRWGGEEFALAFGGVESEGAAQAIGRLAAEVRQAAFGGEGEEQFGVTFSAGVSAYPADGESIDELMRVADRRLYRAKAAGRDRVEFHDG